MAQRSVYPALEDIDPDTATMLANKGAQALQNGTVKPKEVKKTAKAMGLDLGMAPDVPKQETGDEVWARMAPPRQPKSASQAAIDPTLEQLSEYDPQNPVQNGPEVQRAPAGGMSAESEDSIASKLGVNEDELAQKGLKAVSEYDSKRSKTSTRSERVPVDVKKMRDLYNGISMMPDLADQREANQKFEDSLPLAVGPVDKNPWIKGILSGVDAMTGSKMADSYTPGGLSQKERNALLLKYQDEALKRRNDLSKDTMGLLGHALNGGTLTEQIMAMNANKNSTGINNSGFDREAQQERMFADRAHNKVIAKIDADPIFRDQLKSWNGLSMGLATIQNVKNLTPNQLTEAQRTIMAAMQAARGGTSGIDERALMYMNSLGQSGERLMQWLSGEPANISVNDPLVKHIINLAKIEQGNISTLSENRRNDLTDGYGWIYGDPKYAKYKASLDSKIRSAQAQFSNGSGGTSGGSTGKSSAPKAPKSAMPSLDEIDAELARRSK